MRDARGRLAKWLRTGHEQEGAPEFAHSDAARKLQGSWSHSGVTSQLEISMYVGLQMGKARQRLG